MNNPEFDWSCKVAFIVLGILLLPFLLPLALVILGLLALAGWFNACNGR